MRSRTKLIAPFAVLALVLAACGDDDGAAGDGDADSQICQVTDLGGIDDKSFNESAWNGAQRAGDDFGAEARVLQSQAETDYEPNINSFVDEGCDLIVTVGFLLGDATLDAATANPDINFAIVDFAYDDPPDNVKGLVFGTDEAAFLAGYLAAGMTETGTVGTFGGINIPPVTIFMDGFVWGVRHYNEVNGTDVTVLGWNPDTQDGSFTDNFDSLEDGRAFAQSLVDEGADIVLPVAGPVGLGSSALASELGTFSIIGVDVDQTQTDEENASVYLTSVMKGIDAAVHAAAEEALTTDDFSNELYVGILSNDGVDIAPFHDFDDLVPDDLKSELDDLRQGIIDGEVSVGG